MATIYQKTVSDKTCILAPREFILRPFDFQAWTEMRFGVFISAVTSSGNNTNAVNETVALSTYADRIAFGIKDSATNDLPGFGAALFLGAVGITGAASGLDATGTPTMVQITGNAGANTLCAAGFHETTLVGASAGEQLGNIISCALADGATGYCGFYAVKFVITNIGTASQSVAISSANTVTIAGTDYSAQALRLLINGASFGSPVSVAWNTGAAARVIPDAVYIRMPFYSNRIRISAMRAIRYAP